MIRHIVGWKFISEDTAEQDAAFAAVHGALTPLVGVVPGLVDLTVVRAVPASQSSDSGLGLVSHHETVDDLRAYAIHPAHVEAARTVAAHTRDRWALDYEL